MNAIKVLREQAQALTETVRYLEEEATSYEGYIDDLSSDLLGVLSFDVLHTSGPYRSITATERVVIQRLPVSHRDEWLDNLEDEDREYILSQVELIGGYPYDPEVAQAQLANQLYAPDTTSEDEEEGYSYDPDSFEEAIDNAAGSQAA